MNISRVLVDATAAAKSCQSPANISFVSIARKWQLTLSVQVSGVQWHTVFLLDSWVEITLHVVHGLRDQVQA